MNEINLTNKEIVHILRAIEIVKPNTVRNVKVYKELKELENKLKTIIPFVKLLVVTIESLERTNNNITENLTQTNTNYYNEVCELENEIKELKQKLNALHGKEEK